MIQGLIGRKLGMSQIYDTQGRLIPVTVLKVGPCVVVQRKDRTRDGYDAVQLGFQEPKGRKPKRPLAGHLKKAGIGVESGRPDEDASKTGPEGNRPSVVRLLREFPITDPESVPETGGIVDVGMFSEDDRVDVIGKSRGAGFSGVIKRYGFRGGKATHGSMFHRAPGSIGASAYPSRVFRGTRMPGRMGNRRITVRNLVVVRIDKEKHLLLVRGAVPGPKKGIVLIRKSLSARKTGAESQ